MKTYWENGGIAPRILDLGARLRSVVSFTPRPLYPQGKSPSYPLDRRLGGPQSRSGHGSVCMCSHKYWPRQQKFHKGATARGSLTSGLFAVRPTYYPRRSLETPLLRVHTIRVCKKETLDGVLRSLITQQWKCLTFWLLVLFALSSTYWCLVKHRDNFTFNFTFVFDVRAVIAQYV
jgi:hypothetical protein